MWTRGKDTETDGKFEFAIYSAENELVMRVGGFACPLEADRAAEVAHRTYLMDVGIFGKSVHDEIPASLDDIDLDELLAEIAA